MSGYAAAAVLRETPIHAGRALQTDRSWAQGELELDHSMEVEDDLAPPAMSLDDRIHYLREVWSQTTFFLFDPQSWR